jgi:hypothetical protein
VEEMYNEDFGQTKRNWVPWAFVIGSVGLSIYLIHYPLAEWCGSEAFFIKILKDIGIALLISAIAALVLERLVHESLLKSVHTAVEAMNKGADVLQGAGELRVEDIFARRRGISRDRLERKVRISLEEQLMKKSGEILIACVAAPEFFIQGSKIGALLWNNLTDANNKCSLRALLLCPKSQWASLRADLEPGHPTISHIGISATFLHNLRRESGGRVKFNCYDFPPIAFLVITDKFLFVEAYPMVQLNIGEGPIGGVSPILIVRNDSEIYKRWKGHFEFIWKEKSNDYEGHHP